MRTGMLGDLDGRDLIWLTVLGSVAEGPAPLGPLVSRLEDLVLGELDGPLPAVAPCLHEMHRGGHIVLANGGAGWRVSMGPNGRPTFLRLMASAPVSHSPSLEAVGARIRAEFARLVGRRAA